MTRRLDIASVIAVHEGLINDFGEAVMAFGT